MAARSSLITILSLGLLGCASETPRPALPFSDEDLKVVSRTLEEVLRVKRQEIPNVLSVLRVIDETILFGPDRENQLHSELGGKAGKVSKDLCASLFTRNTRALPIRELALVTPKVVVKPLSPLYSDGWNESEIFAKISRPGYDAEKRTAMMYCRIGPSAHSQSITVLLERNAGEWRVKWSRMASYF